MNGHPLLKALLAEGYIAAFALCAVYVPKFITIHPGPVFGIAAFLSLFVFSAACMGYLFLSTPLLLALESNPKGAVKYFAQTLLYFALMAAVSIALLFILHI